MHHISRIKGRARGVEGVELFSYHHFLEGRVETWVVVWWEGARLEDVLAPEFIAQSQDENEAHIRMEDICQFMGKKHRYQQCGIRGRKLNIPAQSELG